jgi:hypothetical protein
MKNMKRIVKYIACIVLPVLSLISCGKEETIIPSSVINLRYETTPGRIVLRWDTPQDENIKYIQADYYNPLTRKDERRLASIYADSLEIPDTRRKYGEYTFSVKTVSLTNDYSETETITAVSEAAEKTWIPSAVKLTADMLYTNAQEPTEGPIVNLLDDNTGTFFHTAWSKSIPSPHYMTVTLPETIDGWWNFYYAPRNNSNNKPTDFDLEGSMDGSSWFLIKNFTKEADGLPTDKTTAYTSERLNVADKPFNHLKFSVNKTNNNTVYWTMSEFKIYKVTLIDPEAPDEE